jgi:hypothetical protein
MGSTLFSQFKNTAILWNPLRVLFKTESKLETSCCGSVATANPGPVSVLAKLFESSIYRAMLCGRELIENLQSEKT